MQYRHKETIEALHEKAELMEAKGNVMFIILPRAIHTLSDT